MAPQAPRTNFQVGSGSGMAYRPGRFGRPGGKLPLGPPSGYSGWRLPCPAGTFPSVPQSAVGCPGFGTSRRRTFMRAFPLALTTLLISVGPLPAQNSTAPPVAPKVPKVDTLHGEIRVDDYYWLREKANPEVIRYLEAENAYTQAGLKHLESLREALYQEMLGRIKETDQAVPYYEGGHWYYTRTEQGKSYPIYCRKKGTLDAPEEIILDQNRLAEGKKFHALGGFDVSPDGKLLIYLEDTTAFREYTLHVKDLRTGRLLPDAIRGVWNGIAWADDNRTFFYLTPDSAKRGNAIWRHALGEPKDEKIFQEDNLLYNVFVFRSKSGKYAFLGADGFTSSEWRAIPTATPKAAPRDVAAPRPRAGDANWRAWRAGRDSVSIEALDVTRRFVVVSERAGGLRRLKVTELATGQSHVITFPEPAYGVFPSQNQDYDA